MKDVIRTLRRDFPQFTFTLDELLRWSPETQEIFYTSDEETRQNGGLLHELGHALLDHKAFVSDIDLVHKEVAAWEKAKELAAQYDLHIDDMYIQTCLNSYRDWLHKRSTCPACSTHGVQASYKLYKCLNCAETWKVSSSTLCRPYRRSKTA